MLLDFWTAHYASRIAKGESVTEFEDDNFDDLLKKLDSIADDDEWEDVP